MLSRCEMCSSRYVLVKNEEPERSFYEVWGGRLDMGKEECGFFRMQGYQ
jgi:hypothetical protein